MKEGTLDSIDTSDNLLTNLTIDDEFDRTPKYVNDMGFDLETLQRRKNDMKKLQEAYPKMTPQWLEMAWNFCEITPMEEQNKIVKEGLWEGKPINKRQTGGLIVDAMVIEPRPVEAEAETH